MWLVGVGLLFGSVRDGAAAYQPPACISMCDLTPSQPFDCCARESANLQFELAARCSRFIACKNQQQEVLDSDIADNCNATLNGRCTILLGCVKKQEMSYRRALRNKCVAAFLGETPELCEVHNPRGRRDIDRVCSGCISVAPAPTTTTSTTVRTSTSAASTTTGTVSTTTTTTRIETGETPPIPDDPCYRQCLRRIDSLQKCYSRCTSLCEHNQRAIDICRAGCRNGTCTTIKARCAGGSKPTRSDKDPAVYQACCRPDESCLTKDDAPCQVIPTTSTSTQPTTTSVASTTSTTTSTTLM